MSTRIKINKIISHHSLKNIQWAWKLSIKSRELLIGKLYFLHASNETETDPQTGFFFLHDNLTSLANNNDIKFEACKFSLQQNSTLEVFYAHIAKLIAREEVETCWA